MLKAVYAADDVRCAVIFIDTAVAIVRSRCLMTVIKPDYIDPHKLRRPDDGEARPISAPDTRHKRLSDISAIKRHKDNHLTAAAHGGHLNSHRPSSTADVMLPAVFAFRLIHSMCLTSALDTQTLGVFRISFPGEPADDASSLNVSSEIGCSLRVHVIRVARGEDLC